MGQRDVVRAVPFNVCSFQAGEKKLENVHIFSIFFNHNENPFVTCFLVAVSRVVVPVVVAVDAVVAPVPVLSAHSNKIVLLQKVLYHFHEFSGNFQQCQLRHLILVVSAAFLLLINETGRGEERRVRRGKRGKN